MVQELPAWFEGAALGVLLLLLAADLAVVAWRPHVPSLKECALWVSAYAVLALAFAVLLLVVPGGGGQQAGEFTAGWITEYSLSVDNLFVFIILMGRFAVPREVQQVALMGGIIIALLLRGVFILLGSAAIEHFTWVFFLFGAFLVYTAVKLVVDHARGRDEHGASSADDEEGGEEGAGDSALVRRLRRVLPLSTDFEGRRLVVRRDGRRLLTPLVLVLVALGSTDVLFALDSIPAIFGLTKDPFLVFSTNLFALMGLRQLYFLLGGLLDRLVYLSYGLGVVLAFIGVKLVLEALHENELPFVNGGEPVGVPEVSTWLSLGVIVVTLLVTTVTSLLRSRVLDRRRDDLLSA